MSRPAAATVIVLALVGTISAAMASHQEPVTGDECVIYEWVVHNHGRGLTVSPLTQAAAAPADAAELQRSEPDAFTTAAMPALKLETWKAWEHANHQPAKQIVCAGVPVDDAPDSAQALLRLSPIAYDSARTQALVGWSASCGTLCGFGGIALFVRVDGEWVAKATWIRES